jgi:predicted transcriptional regulator
MAAAERERADAAQTHQRAASVSDRVAAWLRGNAGGVVTATSTAEGEAHAEAVTDPTGARGTSLGTQVTSSGRGSVTLGTTPEPVMGGRRTVTVDASAPAGADAATARVAMEESSRSVKGGTGGTA